MNLPVGVSVSMFSLWLMSITSTNSNTTPKQPNSTKAAVPLRHSRFAFLLMDKNVHNYLLSKHKQIFMSYQQEIVLNTVSFPISCSFTVMLLFNNKLLQRKSCVLKYLHDIKAHRYHTAFLTSIAHKHSTEFSFFKHSIALSCNELHSFQKVFYF